MKSLYWSLAVVLLSGCSQGEVESVQGMADGADRAMAMNAAMADASVAKPFAGLPDKGNLVDYRPAVRRSGAYTWHAVGLSERHAINAIVTGEMTVTAPDGTPVKLQYDRHVEHDDGNWSWVGTTASGEQALITFGDTAAFGSIPQGRGRAPLRLTTVNGRTWVVATDRQQLAAVNNEATDPTGPDYFVPPKLGASLGALSGVKTAAAMSAVPAAMAAAATQVDVLVGYTQGFASALGGQAAARTRIQNLVDITNQAYANSQVDARVNLVHTMQVTYPDATDNGTALEELTGFRAPSTPVEPDPAFSALRAAREQYGADLVTLVRKFQTPENGGCGIAWLIGGGMSGIVQSDEFFGYSVVSDGQDAGSDGTYYCRDETFAHELGHNMGSQHDAATANDSPGVYAYSFGYKTVANGNFYTVMAYGDSGQQDYRVFSNPDITFCGGHSCGVANESDNARSLDAAIPVIATFRASAPVEAAVHFDFDGDGNSGMFWHDVASGKSSLWPSANRAAKRYLTRVDPAWKVVGVGDFDGDGRADILWRNPGTGANTIWPSGNSSAKERLPRVTGGGWQVGPIADFTGDGRDDILWVNPSTGQNSLWPSADRSAKQAVARIKNTDWKVVGGADFNGDGEADMLMRNSKTGQNLLWKSANSSRWQLLATVTSQAWKVAATGDFNGDGKADIFWHRDSTGQSSIWPSANRSQRQSVTRLKNPAWRLRAVGDFNGDGEYDVVWRNRGSGGNIVWYSADSGSFDVLPSVKSASWRLVHF